ncbi:MAG: DNA-binding protein [Verrucomicrobia bacterium]|jgi:N-glycosylase/DNA lyase|nr:DNA-binding protein [Verrucomicrobiota bacterium]
MSGKGWCPLEGEELISETALAETLVGGQAFRWFWREGEGAWLGIWERNAVYLRRDEGGVLSFRSPTGTDADSVAAYLARGRSRAWARKLPLAADPVLHRLAAKWSGLSLLAQPLEETLLAFLCSSNKRIRQIRDMLERLASAFGEPIQGTGLRALPSWERLATVSESSLRACALGYRAPNVLATARRLAADPEWANRLASLPYREARDWLQQLPGVGAKVADCVLLFGVGRGEAFPVDTWIAKALAGHYPEIARWPREQLATFARIHFGPGAGLAQQWFFAEARGQSTEALKILSSDSRSG